MSAITLTDDDALRLTEAALVGDHDAFIAEMRSAGMAPFLITLAKSRYPIPEPMCSVCTEVVG